MKLTKSQKSMILGISSNEYNGTVYYNCDLYDLESGAMYRCGTSPELFNSLAQQQKPLMINECVIDVLPQYKGQSRLELVSVK